MAESQQVCMYVHVGSYQLIQYGTWLNLIFDSDQYHRFEFFLNYMIP